MKQYYIHYPRNFANEYSIFAASTPEEVDACESKVLAASSDVSQSFDRISRNEADRMTAHNRKEYRLGYANSQNPVGATEIRSASELLR